MDKEITLITDHNIAQPNFIEQLKIISSLGLDRVIIREKGMDDEALYQYYLKIKKAVKNNTTVLVNTEPTFYQKYGIKDIHFSQKNFKKCNNCLLKELNFGVSVHTMAEVKNAIINNPDYLLASHIFKTDCKKDKPPKGLQFLKEIRRVTDVKIIALGGVNDVTVQQLIESDFNHFAVRSYLLTSQNMIKDYKKLMLLYR